MFRTNFKKLYIIFILTALFVFNLNAKQLPTDYKGTLPFKYVEPIIENGGIKQVIIDERASFYAFKIVDESTDPKFGEMRDYLNADPIISETLAQRYLARKVAYEINPSTLDTVDTPVFFLYSQILGDNGPCMIPIPIAIYANENSSDYKYLTNSIICFADAGKSLTIEGLKKHKYLTTVVAHENGHGIMNDLFGVHYSKMRAKYGLSKNGHDTLIISDRAMAFSEGWAEGFEAYMGEKYAMSFKNMANKDENSKKLYNRVKGFLKSFKNKKNDKLSKEDEVIIKLRDGRQVPVRKHRIIWQDGPKEKMGNLKNARQMMSTEGVIASQFYMILLHSGIDGAYEKCCRVLNEYKPETYEDFILAFGLEFPKYKKNVYRIYLENTRYVTINGEAQRLYQGYWLAKKAFMKKELSKEEYYKAKQTWYQWKEEQFQKAMQKDNLTQDVAQHIWVEFVHRKVRYDINMVNRMDLLIGIMYGMGISNLGEFYHSQDPEDIKKKQLIVKTVAAILELRNRKSNEMFDNFEDFKKLAQDTIPTEFMTIIENARETFVENAKAVQMEGEITNLADFKKFASKFMDTSLIFKVNEEAQAKHYETKAMINDMFEQYNK